MAIVPHTLTVNNIDHHQARPLALSTLKVEFPIAAPSQEAKQGMRLP
jgi:hypothetical protein